MNGGNTRRQTPEEKQIYLSELVKLREEREKAKILKISYGCEDVFM